MFPRSISRLANRGLTLSVVLIPLLLTFLAVERHLRHLITLEVASASQPGYIHSSSLHAQHMIPKVGNIYFESKWGNVTSSIHRQMLLNTTIHLPVSGEELVNEKGIVYWQPPPRRPTFSDTVKSERPKVILMKYFPSLVVAESGSEVLQSCPQHSSFACNVTQDPTVNADLVIIYSQYINFGKFLSPPPKPPGQIWVFYAMVSPIYSGNRVLARREWTQHFNWTMTYLNESDIPYTIFKVVRLHSNSSHTVNSSPAGKSLEQGDKRSPDLDQRAQSVISAHDAKLSEVMATKRVTMAVILNICGDIAQRHHFLMILATFAVDQLHIYGKCGTLKCPGNSTDECYKLLERKYFFLLSFENALCQDYVSEVHHILSNYYIVPVVRGRANYVKLTPPRSVIDTSTFHAIRDLSNYLDYLRTNVDKYVRYLSWKREFIVVEPQPFPWCRICAMLQEVNEGKRRHQAYVNVHKWWRKDRCFEPDDLNANGSY